MLCKDALLQLLNIFIVNSFASPISLSMIFSRTIHVVARVVIIVVIIVTVTIVILAVVEK